MSGENIHIYFPDWLKCNKFRLQLRIGDRREERAGQGIDSPLMVMNEESEEEDVRDGGRLTAGGSQTPVIAFAGSAASLDISCGSLAPSGGHRRE